MIRKVRNKWLECHKNASNVNVICIDLLCGYDTKMTNNINKKHQKKMFTLFS